MKDRQGALLFLQRARVVVPIVVLVAMCGLLFYSVLQSPDMLAKIKQRVSGPSPVGVSAPEVLNYIGDGKDIHVGDFYIPQVKVRGGSGMTRAVSSPVVVIVHGGSWSKGMAQPTVTCPISNRSSFRAF